MTRRQRQTRKLEQGDLWGPKATPTQCPVLVPTKIGPRLCRAPATLYRRDERLYFCPEHVTADLTIPLTDPHFRRLFDNEPAS